MAEMLGDDCSELPKGMVGWTKVFRLRPLDYLIRTECGTAC